VPEPSDIDRIVTLAASAVDSGRDEKEAARELATRVGDSDVWAAALEHCLESRGDRRVADMIASAGAIARSRVWWRGISPEVKAQLLLPLDEAFLVVAARYPGLRGQPDEMRQTYALRWAATDDLLEHAAILREVSARLRLVFGAKSGSEPGSDRDVAFRYLNSVVQGR
jgi:hypothetical protein